MTHDRHHFDTDCGGPTCCEHCRRLLSETPEQHVARVAEENRQRAVFRAGCHAVGPHADKLAAMQQFRDRLREQAMLAALQAPPATSKVHLEPPDGYAIAIERMKEDSR